MKNVNVSLGFGGYVAAGLTVGIILILLQNKNAFNVTSPENIANKAAVDLYQSVTGSTETPGGDFYSATHNEDGSVKIWAAPLWFLDKVSGVPTNGVSGF